MMPLEKIERAAMNQLGLTARLPDDLAIPARPSRVAPAINGTAIPVPTSMAEVKAHCMAELRHLYGMTEGEAYAAMNLCFKAALVILQGNPHTRTDTASL